MNDTRRCPECNASIASDNDASGVCPLCGASVNAQGASPRKGRVCINCKTELRGGAVVCRQCGTDQETGKRVISPGQKRGRQEPDGNEVPETTSFALKALLASALLVLAAGVWWFSLDRGPARTRPAPSPPPPARTDKPLVDTPLVDTPLVDTPPAAPPASMTSQAMRATAPLDAALRRYEDQVRHARFDAAEETRRHMERAFAGRESPTSFWQQAFAPAEPMRLVLAYVCPVCRDGKCPVCQGQPACASCKGSGTCSACKGKARRLVACSSCICTNCAGYGRCRDCRGEGKVLCPACNGTGATDSLCLVNCPACGGSGQRKGLRTGGGHMTVRCLTCRGTGKTAQRVRADCPRCSAVTRVTCPTCSASGRCTTCAGKGRIPRCEACGGTGQTTVVCRTCKGGGRCPTCGGAGNCKRCSGTGRCYLCEGLNLIREAELPISSAWSKRKPGFVVCDTATRQITQTATNGGHHEVQLNGRTMVFDVARGQLLWISTTADFDDVPALLAPQQ